MQTVANTSALDQGEAKAQTGDHPACNHRNGDGAATDADDGYSPGDECPRCRCTLGSDRHWYVDADQAPGEVQS